eukprot:TRINITY_DN11481_c0_g1_i2.p1 TRINITY_DN11481_c0_g1~~TRINITY_DN11481_c0_g1_i2.p1  ORF type:complete len:383 (+),score=54.49 TRINITY_DN11481_c0_g1_i2:65-1150(+)
MAFRTQVQELCKQLQAVVEQEVTKLEKAQSALEQERSEAQASAEQRESAIAEQKQKAAAIAEAQQHELVALRQALERERVDLDRRAEQLSSKETEYSALRATLDSQRSQFETWCADERAKVDRQCSELSEARQKLSEATSELDARVRAHEQRSEEQEKMYQLKLHKLDLLKQHIAEAGFRCDAAEVSEDGGTSAELLFLPPRDQRRQSADDVALDVLTHRGKALHPLPAGEQPQRGAADTTFRLSSRGEKTLVVRHHIPKLPKALPRSQTHCIVLYCGVEACARVRVPMVVGSEEYKLRVDYRSRLIVLEDCEEAEVSRDGMWSMVAEKAPHTRFTLGVCLFVPQSSFELLRVEGDEADDH